MTLLALVAGLLPVLQGTSLTQAQAFSATDWNGAFGSRDNSLRVYLQPGESMEVFLGATPYTGTVPDFHGILSGTVTSPDGTVTALVPGVPTVFEAATAAQAGVWTVDLDAAVSPGGTELVNTRYLWSVEVYDGPAASGNVVPGRLWTSDYRMFQADNDLGDITFWMVNDTGYLYRVGLTEFNGWGSRIIANALGGTDENCVPAYTSWDQENWSGVEAGDVQFRPECGVLHRIFFDEPDYDVLPESWTSPVTGETEQILPSEMKLEDLGGADMEFALDGWGPAGTITYQIDSRFTGSYQIQIDTDGNGEFDDPVDRIETLGASGSAGSDVDGDGRTEYSYDFDGLDANGDPVAEGVVANARLFFDKIGEIHLLQLDVEGRQLEMVRYSEVSPGVRQPADDAIYWNDSTLSADGRGNVTPDKGGPVGEFAGVSSTGGVHGWDFGANSVNTWGNNRYIDDWTYVTSTNDTPAISFARSSFTLTKSSDTTKAAGSETGVVEPGESFEYTITATNTSPVALNSLSSPTIVDDLTGILDDVDIDAAGITATIDGAPAGGTLDYTEPLVTWKGALGAGKSVVLTIPVTVKSPLSGDGEIDNIAWTEPAGSTSDETPACDDTSVNAVCVTDHARPLSVAKSADVDVTVLPGVGEQVTYSVLVTNDGPADYTIDDPASVVDDLSDVLDDATMVGTPSADKGAAPVFDATAKTLTWSGALAAGETVTLTYTVQYAGGSDNELVNTACVPEALAVEPCATVQIPGDSVAAMTLAKRVTEVEDVDGDGLTDTGDLVTYEFTVRNTGNVTLTDVGVDDPMLAEAGITTTCTPGTLTPGQSVTCTVSGPYAITEAQTAAGVVENTATGFATVPEDVDPIDPPTATATVETDPVATATLEKTAAITTDGGTSGLADLGDVVTYSFVLENTGNVTLTDVTVEDEMIAAQIGADALAVACSVASLAPGETLECSVEYTVTAADIATDGSTLVNVATGTGTPPEGVPFEEPTDDASVDKADATPSIEVVKDAAPESDLGLGDQVQYGFTVTNTGNVELTGVTVSDPMVGNVTCEATTLAPEASTSCKADATYTITEADLLAGRVENTATAEGTAPDGTTVEDTGTKTVTTVTPVAGLDLVKHADFVQDEGEPGLADAGDVLRFWFEVTNTGDVTVQNVTVTDEMLEGLGLDVTCDPTTLAPDATATCAVSGDYTVTEADVMAGVVRNTATANGDVPEGVDPIDPPEDSTETPTIAAAPGLSVVKTAALADANENGVADVGEQVQYTFVVENTGNVTVDQITVTDEMLAGAGIGVTCDEDSLAPGGSTECRAGGPYPVTDADVAAGSVHNVATAAGRTPDGGDVSDEDTEDVPTVEASTALDVVKTATVADANDNGIADKGEEITYGFTVTNTGTVTLTDLTLVDDLLDAAGVEVTCEATTLAPGAVTTCSVSGPYTVTAADQTAGQVKNTATATAKDPDGGDVTDEGSTTTPVLVPAPAITVEKIASPVDANANGVVDLGEQITYSFAVTNNGNVPLTGLTIADSLLDEAGIGVTCEATDLAVGASTTCTATGPYTVVEADVLAGVVHNEATGTATDPDGGEVTDSDTADVTPAAVSPDLDLVKTATAVDTDGDGGLEVGEQVTYAFTVINTGNVTLTGVDIADSLLAEAGSTVSCDVTDLAPDAVATCAASGPYTVIDADLLAGVVHNEATATATDPDGTEVSDDATADVTTAAAAAGIAVVKDAALADGNSNGAADLGETVLYSFTVTNTGSITLTDVTVADPMLTDLGIDVTCEATALAPGVSTTCTAGDVYTVTEADVLAGTVRNTATATGTPTGGEDVTDDGEKEVPTGAPIPGIEVVKSSTLADTDGNGTGDLGEQITYSFVVTNTGDVTLTGVSVADPMLAAVGITVSCDPATLAPGASVTCAPSGAYTITEADVLAGSVHNVATATGTTPPGVGEPPTNSDDDEVPTTDPAPGIEVVKTAALADTDGNGLADLGELITYSFAVINNGNATLTDVRVDDPMLAAAGITVSCDPTTLAPGGSATCTASGPYAVTEADVLAGQVHNVATATGTPPEGVEPPSDEDETTTGTPVAGPSLLLVKSADLADSNGNGTADLGEKITYSFAVTNNGNVTITDITVDDPMLAAAGISVVCDPTDLAPGESADCTASETYTVTEADVLDGLIANHATVTGQDPTGEPVVDEDEKNVPSTGPVPGIEVVKSSELADTNGNALADVGEQVTYSFVVTNTGNVTLTDVSVDDPKLAAAGISVVCEPSTSAPGDSATCAASGPYTVTEADVLAGGVFNVATATGTTPPGGGEPPTDTDEDEVPSVDPAPGIEVVKTASLADTNTNALADLGEEITYSFQVTNTGNMTLTDVRVDDPMLAAAGIGVVCAPSTLAPGEVASCTVSGPYTVTEADVLAGSVHNVATATGIPPEGVEPPSDEDDTTTGTPVPAASLLLDKVSDLADTNGNGKADAGEEITYSFVVVNNGNVTITDVTVDDPMLDALGITVTCDPSTLAPGEEVTCEASGPYTVTEADVLAGEVANHATVTGTGPGGETPTDEDSDEVPTVDPAPGVEVVKSSDLADVNDNGRADLGEQITYSFQVTNTGNVTLTDVRVDDPKLAAIGVTVVCEPGTLAPGESATCEASGPYTVTEADVLAGVVVNHATATGTTPPGGGEPPTDEDGDAVPSVDPDPALSLDKVSKLSDTNNNGLADLGETISYGFTVTNTGNVTITDVAIVDQKLVDAGIGVTCDALAVAPGDSVSCKADANYTVTEADILSGSVHNVATVTGKDPGGDPVDPPTDETDEPTADPAPGLELVKHADLVDVNGNGKADLGEEISFGFEVSNIGNVTITGVAVDDPMLTALGVTVTCEATDLAPGAGTRCDASAPYTVTEADILAGVVHNVATATGTDPGGEEVDPPTDETETPTPGKDGRLTLVKHADLADANGNGLADVGEQITYGFAVRNVGNVTVSDIAIMDEMLAEAGIEVTCEAASLAPGASVNCTAAAPYTVTDADVEAGSVLNQATATGTDPDGEEIVPPTDEKEVPTPQPDASLLLEKVSTLADTNDNGLADAGEQVTYGFVVTNNGNVTITDISVDDPKLTELGTTIPCDPTTLAPGQSVMYAASGPYTVTEADVVAGGVLNHATVTGTGPGGETPTDEDEDEVPTPTPAPALTLEKISTVEDANGNGLADAGEEVTYSFTVTNTGNVTITDIPVADEKLAALGIDVVCEITSLAPGESVTCTASDVYTVTEADVIAGMVVNHATTTGTGPDGETPTDEDGDEVPTPEPVTALEMVKRDSLADANGNGLADVGEQVAYTFEVTNTGNITVTDVKVDDPKLVEAGIAVTCDPTTLAPGESVTCTAPAYPVTQADVAAGGVLNTATVTGATPDGVDDPTDEDSVTTKTGPKFTSGVLSAGDGPLSALAVTGATVQVAALVALALLGLGVLLVARTRRHGKEG